MQPMSLHERGRLVTIRARRFLLSLRRPGAATNARLARRRGETLDVRRAVASDVPALAALHVETWNDTYAPLMTGPPVAVRERQWRDAFAADDGSWFCFVVTRPDGQLVGFAKGIVRERREDPGELSKLYLRRDHQRLGWGRRLLGHVAGEFLGRGITSMSAFVEPSNPSCRFFEAVGGEWLREPDGRLNFNWYVWSDLRALAARCPVG